MKPNFYSRGSLRGAGKILLFSFFSVFSAGIGYSQEKDSIPVNAYYLSKDLYEFSKRYNAEKPQSDSAIARASLTKLCYYLGTDNPHDILGEIKDSSKMKDLLNDLQISAEYISDSIKVHNTLTSKNSDILSISYLQKENAYNSENQKIINAIKKKIDQFAPNAKRGFIILHKNSLDIRPILGKIYNSKPLVTIIKNSDSLKIDYDFLIYLRDSFQRMKKNIDLKALYLFNNLSPENKKKIVQTNSDWLLLKSFTIGFGNRITALQQQDAEITISLLESSASSVSGWKIPSEAEMIDAVATYIASRVKQETVLWFFDQMRSNTERYDLIMTAFPETMNLIQSSEVFDAPNMGSAWKYALSKDFVHLPKNILSSEWINQRIPEDRKKYLELACVSWEISELISNRLSYRDMIKQLYLKRNLDDSKQIDNFPDSVITFLYAVSNELYIVNKGSVRNLTYEEINSMPFGQLEIMLELLNMKYSNSIDKLFLQKFEHKITKDHKKDIAKWIGNTMLALSQFDKIMQQVEQSRKGNNGETVLFDGYNTWNLISQVIRSSLPARKDAIYKKYLDRADDAFEIYHLLSEKNYAGAVSKTLELVDTLIYNRILIVDSTYSRFLPFLIPINPPSNIKSFNFQIFEKLMMDKGLNPVKVQEFATSLWWCTYYFPQIFRKQFKTVYSVDIANLEKLFTERGIPLDEFIKVSSSTKKTIYLFEYPENIIEIKNQKYIKIHFIDLWNKLKESVDFCTKKKLTNLFNDLSKNQLDKIIQNYTDWNGKSIISSTKIQFPINSIAAQALISKDKKAMQMIMKLASFLNDVSQSDNEKELKKVIESYALPPGSYKQKRNAWHSVTLNAFAGPYFGYETANFLKATKKVSDTSSIIDFGRNYGISVPIGITYTKTFGKKVSEISSIPYAYPNNPDLIRIKRNSLRARSNFCMSFTVSVIDIGAVVSYRMNNTENVLDQSFKWEQFISPGFHLGFSIPKTPLMVQLGYQYTPKVRRIVTGETTNGEETIRKDMQIGMWRSYVGVFFDIPLVNLWMKTRSVKFE